MEIISWNFLLFFTVTVAVYFVLNRRAQNIWLLFVSAFYIALWGWQHLFPLAIIGGTTFLTGKKLGETRHPFWFAAGLSINIAVFFLYRVINSPLFSISTPPVIEDLLLPIGFAFYTLQSISYLIDIHHSKIPAETEPVDFLLYLMFYPKILAGPIERAGNFLPQLKSQRTVDSDKLDGGFVLVLVGLIRKIAIAEVLLTIMPENLFPTIPQDTGFYNGPIPAAIFAYSNLIPYTDRLIGILAYGVYLYNDFAGYTAIMRGASLIMGFELSPNFREPYFANNLSDFWSRWHISLSSWLRDYIYFPMTRILLKKYKNRFFLLPEVLPLIVTMLAAGFWHGLTYPFLLWGLVFGILMSLEKLIFQAFPLLRAKTRLLPLRFINGLLVYLVVNIAWVAFAVNSVDGILSTWKAVLSAAGWFINPTFSLWIVVISSVSFFLDFLESRRYDQSILLGWPIAAKSIVLAIVLITLIFAFTWTSPFTSNVFVYQNF